MLEIKYNYQRYLLRKGCGRGDNFVKWVPIFNTASYFPNWKTIRLFPLQTPNPTTCIFNTGHWKALPTSFIFHGHSESYWDNSNFSSILCLPFLQHYKGREHYEHVCSALCIPSKMLGQTSHFVLKIILWGGDLLPPLGLVSLQKRKWKLREVQNPRSCSQSMTWPIFHSHSLSKVTTFSLYLTAS